MIRKHLHGVFLMLTITVCGTCVDDVIPTDPLKGTTWDVTRVTRPGGDPEKLPAVAQIYFNDNKKFFADLILSGCGGVYSMYGGQGSTGTASMEVQTCYKVTEPSILFTILSTIQSYERTGNILVLNGQGSITLTQTSTCNASAVGCQKTGTGVLALTIKKSDNSDPGLTETRVIRISDGQVIYSHILNGNDIWHQFSTSYTLIDSRYHDLFGNKNVDVEFQGFLGDSMIVQRRYIVTSDCCTLTLVSGDPTIIL